MEILDPESIQPTIERLERADVPRVVLLRRSRVRGAELGVFSSSFNPTTVAHLELMRTAARQYELGEVLALAGTANADKSGYECPLSERLTMLSAAVTDDWITIGLVSTAFFVDMIEPIRAAYPGRRVNLILGFDTFERVLDRDGRYLDAYHGRFGNRGEALRFLAGNSRIIVAGRRGEDLGSVRRLLDEEDDEFRAAVEYLEIPGRVAEQSASEVRRRLSIGASVEGLVPDPVCEYIRSRKLYSRD